MDVMEEFGRSVTSICLNCDSLDDACTWEGWGDREVRNQLDYVTAPRCSKFDAQIHKGEAACMGALLRECAFEGVGGGGQGEGQPTEGSLDNIQEKIEKAARRAEATTSTKEECYESSQ